MKEKISDSMAASNGKTGCSLSDDLQVLNVFTSLFGISHVYHRDTSYVVLYYCLTFHPWMSYFLNIIVSYWQGPSYLFLSPCQ